MAMGPGLELIQCRGKGLAKLTFRYLLASAAASHCARLGGRP